MHGKFWYDVWMGVELNPRIGSFDIKLFMIGRIGMLGWGVMLLALMAKQYEDLGYLPNSMILLCVFQLIYIIDWAWKEEWYLIPFFPFLLLTISLFQVLGHLGYHA